MNNLSIFNSKLITKYNLKDELLSFKSLNSQVLNSKIDYEGKLSVGSVKDSTIHELWKGEKYRQLFDMHKNNNRQNYFPCDRCPVGT